MRFTCVPLVIFILAGCGKAPGDKDAVRQEESAPASVTRPSPVSPSTDAAATRTLVEVNGKVLTHGEALTQVRFRMAAMKNPIPPQALPRVRMQMLGKIVDQFVTKTVLLEEADRRNITVTDAEVTRAFDAIKARLPAGQTLEGMLANSPFDEKRMREDVVSGIRLNKILEPMVSNSVTVTEQDVQAFYDDFRSARHILVKVETTDSEEVKKEKKEKAATLRKQIVRGADFAEMARKHSDCPSKQRGGDLGHFPRGRMDPAFEKSVFSQKIGDISPLVETKFGYHIIQVQPLKKEGAMAENRVRRHLMKKKRFSAVEAYVKTLKDKADIKLSPGFASATATPPSPPASSQ